MSKIAAILGRAREPADQVLLLEDDRTEAQLGQL
jgi:hypothetical protein